MYMGLRKHAVVLLVLCCFTCAHAQFDPDPFFNGTGRSEVLDGFIQRMAVRSDGSILVCGGQYLPGGPPTQVAAMVAQFQADGTLDPAFGQAGVVLLNFDTAQQWPLLDLALQADGKVVAVGMSWQHRLFTTRLHANGDLDTTFGAGGVVYTDLGVDVWEQPCAVQVLPDGRIVVAGVAITDVSTPFLARFTPSGVPDAAFGTDGVSYAIVPPGCAYNVFHMVVQPDGRFLLEGSQDYCGDGANTLLVRFDADGGMDGTFGSAGVVLVDLGAGNVDYGRDVHLMPDGRIVVSGCREHVGSVDRDLFLARFMPDGTLDASFGDGGSAIAPFISGQMQFPTEIQELPDHSITLTGGHEHIDGYYTHSFLQFSADGIWNEDLGVGGYLSSGPGPQIFIVDAALQVDGGLLLAQEGDETCVLKYTSASSVLPETGSHVTDLVLFPDPAVDRVVVRATCSPDRPVRIELMDMNGRLLRRIVPTNWRSTGVLEEVVDIAHLAPGCYQVIMRTERVSRGMPLIKL